MGLGGGTCSSPSYYRSKWGCRQCCGRSSADFPYPDRFWTFLNRFTKTAGRFTKTARAFSKTARLCLRHRRGILLKRPGRFSKTAGRFSKTAHVFRKVPKTKAGSWSALSFGREMAQPPCQGGVGGRDAISLALPKYDSCSCTSSLAIFLLTYLVSIRMSI